MRRFLAALLFLPACGVNADVARVPVVDSSVEEVDTGAFTCAPGMIHLGTFCIDATEVTKKQYAAFLASKPGAMTDPRCAWNAADFAPKESADSCSAAEASLTAPDDTPVVCIDWCDALAYCAWAGKRLCGAIGGGPEPYRTTMNDVTKSQWYAACAGGESMPRKYPYGNTYERGRCADVDKGAPQPVGSMRECHGPVGTPQAAVFDMSGNVYEWTDNCMASATDPSLHTCLARGGFFRDEDVTDAGSFPRMTCDVGMFDNPQPRGHFDDHIGIRCCSP